MDNPSTDVDEYFELVGTPGLSLDNIFYITLGDTGPSGNAGVVEDVTDLTGSTIPASGFFVAAESTFTLGTADLTTTLAFENSDNITHLLVTNFSGAPFDDLDTDDDGVLDSTPWILELDRIANIEENNPPSGTEFHFGPPLLGPDGIFMPGHAYRSPDGANTLTSWNIGKFDNTAGDDTPGAANAAPEISAAAGGRRSLVLDAGPASAGSTYLILCGISGTSPGLPLPAGTLPLNLDAVTNTSLAQASGPVFEDTFSTLDAVGRGYAYLNLPALGPGLIGSTLNSAGVVFSVFPTVDLITNATGTTIIP